MNKKHLYSAEQKLEWWGDGEWVNEPDVVEFEECGIRCFVRRVVLILSLHMQENEKAHLGMLNGYAALPHNHPWNFSEKLRDSCDVHGGVTFFGKLDKSFLFEGKPKPASNWIGFDTSHGFDLVPSMGTSFSEFESCVYKNMDYVINECKEMAKQINENGLMQ